jgi:hypothetical protein
MAPSWETTRLKAKISRLGRGLKATQVSGTRSPARRYPNSAHFDPVIQTRNQRLPHSPLFSHE